MQSKLYHSQALTLDQTAGALTLTHLEVVFLAEPGTMTLDQLEIKLKPLQLEALLLRQQEQQALRPTETTLLDLLAVVYLFSQTSHHSFHSFRSFRSSHSSHPLYHEHQYCQLEDS